MLHTIPLNNINHNTILESANASQISLWRVLDEDPFYERVFPPQDENIKPVNKGKGIRYILKKAVSLTSNRLDIFSTKGVPAQHAERSSHRAQSLFLARRKFPRDIGSRWSSRYLGRGETIESQTVDFSGLVQRN